jgi:hypothetical protein
VTTRLYSAKLPLAGNLYHHHEPLLVYPMLVKLSREFVAALLQSEEDQKMMSTSLDLLVSYSSSAMTPVAPREAIYTFNTIEIQGVLRAAVLIHHGMEKSVGRNRKKGNKNRFVRCQKKTMMMGDTVG